MTDLTFSLLKLWKEASENLAVKKHIKQITGAQNPEKRAEHEACEGL